jgi:hypothetical protein
MVITQWVGKQSAMGNTLHANAGDMVMADGSAHQFSQTALAAAMASSGDSRNCALKPN